MTNNKLPPYFEKYFENKFGEIQSQIAELKLHVNDELEELRAQIEANQKNIYRIWIAMALMTPIYIKDSGDYLLSIIRQFIGF